MMLAGAAVLLLAWSVEPAVQAPASNVDVREVDFDDPARVIITSDDPMIFDTPLQPSGSAPDATTGRDGPATNRGTSGGSRGVPDPGTRPNPATGGGTSTPTPTTPAPTTPAPTTDGGSSTGGGSVPDPGTTPIPTPTPTPPAGGPGTPNSGIKVVVTSSDTTISVGAGISLTTGRSAHGTIVSATTPTATTPTTTSTTSMTSTTSTDSTVTASAGSTSATIDTSTSTATVTAGGITLTVPLVGTVTG